MKRLVFAALLLATPALAAEPPTITLPTPLVSALVRYLAQRPYAQVARLMGEMQACVAVQAPDARGAIVSHGECPAVTRALAARKPKPAPKPIPAK